MKSRIREIRLKLCQSLRNLPGTSVPTPPRCLSNFRAIRSLWYPILRLRDFRRFGGKTYYRLVNRGSGLLYILNSLAPGRFEWNVYKTIFPLIPMIDIWSICWNVTPPYRLLVYIGSGDDLLPSSNKPLLEPMVTQISVGIWAMS